MPAGLEASYRQDIAGRRLVSKLVNRNYPNLRRNIRSSREDVDISGLADRTVEQIQHSINVDVISDL